MKTPTERAAQLWCLPQFEHRVMDVEFATAIANTIQEALKEQIEKNAVIATAYKCSYKECADWEEQCGPDIAKAIRTQGGEDG